MKTIHTLTAVALAAMMLTGPAHANPVVASDWGNGALHAQENNWQLEVRFHPASPYADDLTAAEQAAHFVTQASGHAVEFVGGAGQEGGILLRLRDAADHDSVTDAAAAVGLLHGVLWVSVVPAEREDVPPFQAMQSPEQGDPVELFRVVFTDINTRSAQSRSDALPELLVQAMRQQMGTEVELVRPMSGGAWVFSFPTPLPEMEAEAALEALRKLPQVESAYVSHRVLPQIQPNDPLFPVSGQYGQYNLVAPGTPGPWGNPVFGIDTPNAWNIRTGSAATRIAVVDTGVRFNHPDLSGRFTAGYDFVSNDSDPSDPGDYCPPTGRPSSWHGTHIAGTIAANTNDGIGAAGIDWQARIVPVRSLGQCGGSMADVIDGMRWAAGLNVPGAPANPNPARIINLSLAGVGACDSQWQAAINQVTAAGALVIVAAGNQNTTLDLYSPASCNGVITVVASDPEGNKASYSNFGGTRMPELAAPGGDLSRFGGDARAGIIAAGNSGTTTPASNNWVSKAGTSMAVPHVAGVAGLLLAVNPALSPSQLFSLLTNPAHLTPFAANSDFTANFPRGGRGILNAYLAVSAAQAQLPPSGNLENPVAGATESGIGIVSGWHCSASTIEVVINGISRGLAYVGSRRADTLPVCGKIENGFSMLINFNNLAPGTHNIQVFGDGILFASRQFATVRSGGVPFLEGVARTVAVPDFPSPGITTFLQWSQAKQSFVVVGSTAQ